MTGKKAPTKKKDFTKAQISAMQEQVTAMVNDFVSRNRNFSPAGFQYSGDRDIYRALGYKQSSELTYDSYFSRYDRQDIAKAIIDRPVDATWRGDVGVIVSDDEDTPLEVTWADLYSRLSLKSKFVRLDKLTGIGEYGVLLLGFNDVKKEEDFKSAVTGQKLKLLYVKPLSQNTAVIDTFEKNSASERFGLPLLYKITISDPGTSGTKDIQVHWTRVIHVADGLLESETCGTPRLKPVLNRLYDIEKLTGGSAEMFWRGARPGYQGVVDKDFNLSDEMRATLQDQAAEFNNNMNRLFMNEGIELKPLAPQVSDPSNHLDIQIQMISAETNIPKRILTGSERGELASGQDDDNWNDYIDARRENYAEPLIVIAFVDRMIEYGVLPKEKYTVGWVDLWSPSEKEKAEIGKIISESLAFYTRNIETMNVIPPEAFLRYILGLSDDKIDLILEELKKFTKIEDDDFDDTME